MSQYDNLSKQYNNIGKAADAIYKCGTISGAESMVDCLHDLMYELDLAYVSDSEDEPTMTFYDKKMKKLYSGMAKYLREIKKEGL
jgi:hypothetical protein